MQVIYLDAAVTVPTSDEVRDRMSQTLENSWGNVSGAHQVSRQAKNLLESARENFSRNLGIEPDNLIFTSGATESLNIAIQGFGRKHPQACILYSEIEHPAVIKPAQYFAEHGHDTFALKVNSSGIVDLDQLDRVKEGDLVCVMPVNNEIGVVNDVFEIAEIVHERGGYLLVDCVQSFYAFEPRALCEIADFAVFSSHKLGGPQGVGLLVIKDRKLIDPLSFGGSQEWEIRPGTTPAYLIDAFDFVFDKAIKDRDETIAYISECKKVCLEELSKNLEDIKVHASDVKTSPHIVSVDINGLEAQMLVAMIDAQGVCVSRGSACASGASTPSPVLLAIGIEKSKATSTLRLSFHAETKIEDIVKGVEIISNCASQLRVNSQVGV